MAQFEPKPFGKYFLTEKIAVGGMAEIYKGKTFGVDGFEKLLAIKKILPHYSADKEFIAMLTDEAKLVVKLSHTNIVQIYDLGKVGDDYYISMEYIGGVNLREVLTRSRELKEKIPLPICLFICAEALQGLDYAHNKRDEDNHPLGIVHRDISPQNILISQEGEPKIVDFGIAKAAMNVSHTTAGILKGKITYMSPEQALGKPVDHRTDLYSMGLILYELITGHRFYTGDNQFEILRKIRETQITESTLGDKISRELRPILAKALAYNVKNRYASAGDFMSALTKILYSNYSDFSSRQISSLIRKWFPEEMGEKRKERKESEPEIDSQTKSLLKDAAPDSILEETGQKTSTLFHETTLPEEGISPDELDHGHLPRPRASTGRFHPRRKGPELKNIRPLFYGGLALVAVALIGFGVFRFVKNRPQEPGEPLPPVVEEEGQLEINSKPEGAKVLLDGVDTGEVTPTVISPVKIGEEHTIRLELEGRQPWSQTVVAESSEPVVLSAELKPVPYGKIEIRSEPEGARIFLNGEDMEGETPAALEELEVGKSYTILLKMEEFKPFERTITVSDETTISLDVKLERMVLEPARVEPEKKPPPLVDTKTPVEPDKPLTPVVETKPEKPKPPVADTKPPPEKQKPKPVVTETKPPTQKEKPKPTVTETKPPPVKDRDKPIEKEIPGPLGQVRIDSKPRGAGVVFNGRRAGITPVVIPNVARGESLTITLTHPGYQSWSRSFKLSKGYMEFMANLERE